MSCIAIITARGGSKRIPRKNIKEFMGKPMIAYAIEAAKKSAIFDTVMVSTDDEEIATIAKYYGAEVPFMRSERTSSDYATTFDVLEEVIQKYKKQNNEFDSLCCIYPCVPFLTPLTLKHAYNTMQETKANAVQPVCKYSAPIEWAMKIEENFLFPNDPKMLTMRSQDLVPKYFDVGMFYFIKVKTLLEEKTMVPSKTAGYVIDEMECQDIDTIEDWHNAEMKYKVIMEK
ncbi:MAG: pseudaminic acid cytidylyltransferase [Clostridiaceae bacterium]|nr:pseudaminic acid cytidylyltransferase [Clostridiaceae bacterium]